MFCNSRATFNHLVDLTENSSIFVLVSLTNFLFLLDPIAKAGKYFSKILKLPLVTSIVNRKTNSSTSNIF